jgi:hypothetical protein
MPRLKLLVVVLALAAAVLSGCGNKESKVLEGSTEGSYLDVGDLKYQVQISRILNPASREDRSLLIGLPAGQRLGAADQWFAIFMRVQNTTGRPLPMAQRYEIEDTQGNRFHPIAMGRQNVFAYRSGPLAGNEIYPPASTPAAESTIQGSLLLFKIPNADLENRPLELRIRSPLPPGELGEVALDV